MNHGVVIVCLLIGHHQTIFNRCGLFTCHNSTLWLIAAPSVGLFTNTLCDVIGNSITFVAYWCNYSSKIITSLVTYIILSMIYPVWSATCYTMTYGIIATPSVFSYTLAIRDRVIGNIITSVTSQDKNSSIVIGCLASIVHAVVYIIRGGTGYSFTGRVLPTPFVICDTPSVYS